RMVGAVSGGCVEKEIQKQAATVLNSGIPKMMTYDGRYRLGCEGILYILLEPFWPSKKFLETFDRTLQNRHPFSVSSWFVKRDGENLDLGSFFGDRKSTRLNSSHVKNSYAVFCLKKKNSKY